MMIDLQKHIEASNLFQPLDTVIVALSGGVDSMVLFDILRKSKFDLKLVIAHVNHKKRQESEIEFESIKLMANEFRIPFEGYEITDDLNSNFHDDSRNQRYTFFKKVAQKYGATKIVLAHHLDDQVETILMRVVRGTSFSGYSGIPEIRSDNGFEIIRPLLEISKQEILSYAKQNNITYYEDNTNKEDFYTRNRFRNSIIPLLKDENPNLSEKIIQFRNYILSANIVLEKLKDEFFQSQESQERINVKDFNLLDNAVKYLVLTKFINNTSGNLLELNHEQMVKLLEICDSPTPNQRFSLGKEYLFKKEYNFFYIDYKTKNKKTNIEVNACGEYFIEDNHLFIISDTKIEHIDTNYFELCYNDKVFPLYLRNRKNGDKIKLSVGTKKVKDILIDQKIPVSDRQKLVLVADENNVLWIPKIKKSIQNSNYENRLFIYEVKKC